jgi:hypothetical protein
VNILSTFDTGASPADSYGGRIQGWLYAPKTGDYTFWLSCADEGELWLSTDEEPANATRIGYEPMWGEYNSFPAPSGPHHLVQGERYYIRAIWTENDQWDHMQVAWNGAGIRDLQTIISSSFMAPYDPVQASTPFPANEAVNVAQTPILRWIPGTRATDHTVFLGTDPEDLPQVGTSSLGDERYAVSVPLDVNQVYYWRVDESNSVTSEGPWTGKTWSFTTADHPIIDDMENYTDDPPDIIYETWRDRFDVRDENGRVVSQGNGTGMRVGALEDPFGPERDEDLVYSGLQSLPLTYDNRGELSSLRGVTISEANRTFSSVQNWAMDSDGRDLEFLQLMLRGRYLSPCTYNYDDVNNQYTVIGAGNDIYGESDEFHFAYQSMPLGGAGSISAQVISVENTDRAAKGGVMIRNGLEPDAEYAAVVSLPDGDIVFQYRRVSGTDANIVRPDDYDQSQFTLPYWVKIKTDGTRFTAQMSDDGEDWVDINEPVYISMVDYVYAGLAVSAHKDDGTPCEAVFSNVDIQGTNPTLDVSVDIGLPANDPANLYIRLKDATGATDTWDDPCGTDALSTNEYRAVNIPLSEFDEIDLTRVEEMVIGIGDASQAGGKGRVYVDDIALFYTEPGEPNRPPVGEPVDPGTDNLVAAYSFEGDVTDTSGNGNDGTMMGDPGFVQGVAGQALDLDGDGDYVDCGNTDGNFDITGEVSVAMWSKLTSPPISWAAAVAKGEGAWRIGIVDTSRKYHFAITDYGPPTVHAVDGNVTVRLDEWHHVVGVCDGSNIMIYVDGELDNSVATASPITVTNRHMLIGENPGATGRYWTGQLDEIKIYNKALSAEEVLYLSQ